MPGGGGAGKRACTAVLRRSPGCLPSGRRRPAAGRPAPSASLYLRDRLGSALDRRLHWARTCASPNGSVAMRRSRIFGISAILIISGLLAAALPVAAAQVQAVMGRVIGSHGTLMVAASNGMTLYTFTKDVAGSGTSACTGGCLDNWPALTITAGDTPTGDSTVTGTLGTIVRSDNGATQVTYNGLPLYFFAKDTAPGDTNGIYPNWEAVVLAAPAPPVVIGREIGSHGTLMVAASSNMTLYTFTKDVAGSGTSACTGGCLDNWPALTITAGDTPTGDSTVTGTLGTIVRSDNGATQVTYN